MYPLMRLRLLILRLMYFGVAGTPSFPADIAKLVFALASHMITSLVLLYNHLAFPALSVMQVVLEVV